MKQKRATQSVLIPRDLAVCQALIEQLFRTVAEQQELLATKKRDLLAKRVLIEDLLRARFGRRSERYKADPNQLLLDFPGVPGIESIAEGLADAMDDLRDQEFRRVLRTGPVGTDDTTVTLLLPPQLPTVDPENPRSQRIHEVLAAAREGRRPTVTARMWAYRSI